MLRSNRNWHFLASLLFAVSTLCSGCALWESPKLDFNQFRDPRAVDIDDRLAAPPPQAIAQ